MKARAWVVAGLLGLSPAALPAQMADDGPLATVQRLFDAMRQRDTAAMRALMAPEVRLVSVGFRAEGPALRVATLDDWLQSVGRANVALDERIWDPEVELDQAFATVWVKYELLVDGEFSHCGVDAFQLFQTLEGWRIFQVADTRRRQHCWHEPN